VVCRGAAEGFDREIEWWSQKLVEASEANQDRCVAPKLLPDAHAGRTTCSAPTTQATEAQFYCLSKGKEHKKHEFGSKASVILTKTHGVIVGAVAYEENLYDGDALRPAREQTRAITDQQPAKSIADRGYRGRNEVAGTQGAAAGEAQARPKQKGECEDAGPVSAARRLNR